MPDEIILRRWTGKVATERAAEYAKYMAETGAEEIETGDPRAANKRRAANTAAPAAERDDLDRVEQLLRKMEQTNT